MTHGASAFLLAATLLAPSLLALPAAVPVALAAPQLAPHEALRLVADRLGALDGGASARALAPLLRPATGSAGPATAAWGPIGTPGETTYVNDTTWEITEYTYVASGARLEIRNSTVRIVETETSYAALVVHPGAELSIADSRVEGSLSGYGPFVATRTTFARARVDLAPYEGAATIEDAVFTEGAEASLSGANASIRRSLFYNHTCGGGCSAVRLGANATVEDSTFVNNDVGVQVVGADAIVRGSTFRFNLVGVRVGGTDATIATNDITDNYVDGVYAEAGATADASGNWWGGVPNQDGDSFGGAGLTVSSWAAGPVAAPSRAGELPFPLHSIATPGDWSLGTRPGGPVITRAAVTLSGLDVEMDGFRLGSHAGAPLTIRDATVRHASVIVSRANDVFERATIIGDTTQFGIQAMSTPLTVRDSRFVGLGIGVVGSVRALGDAPSPLLVEGSTFERNAIGVAAIISQPTVRNSVFRDGLVGVITVLAQSPRVEGNLVEGTQLGIVTALDQGFVANANTVTDALIGFAGVATPSVAIDSYQGRANALDLVMVGSKATFTRSNAYDAPFFVAFVNPLDFHDPQTGQDVHLDGSITVDPTSFLGGATRGDVTFVPPRRTSPGAVTGPAPGRTPVVVASGEVLDVTGVAAATAPWLVRSGGTLRIRNADLALGTHVVGVERGATLEIANSTVTGGMALAIRAEGARLMDSTFVNATIGVADASATIVRDRFLGASAIPLLLYESSSLVDHCLFETVGGLQLVNATYPQRSRPLIQESFFRTSGAAIVGNDLPVATVRNVSFLGRDGIDARVSFLGSQTAPGTATIDARDVWWGHPSGPSTHEQWTPGATASWRDGSAPILVEPWRTTMWRAAFEPSKLVATDDEPVTFRDRTFDLDGAALSYRWDFDDGTEVVLDVREPAHVFQAPGPRNVRLEVLDDRGRPSVAERTVLVKAVPRPALAAPTEALSLEPVRLDAGASLDPDGRIVAYAFAFGDGTATPFAAASSVEHAYARAGVYRASVTVRDDEGHERSTAVDLTILNRAPVAAFSATPAAPTRADDVAFRSLSTDADGTIADLTWDLGDGSPPATGPLVSHRYAALGSFTVTLTATDDLGATSQAIQTIEVSNALPVAAFDVGPALVKPGMEVTFTSRATDPDGPAPAHAWDLGDGTSSTEVSTTHVYADEGDFLVRLAVTDADGGVATAERLLVVRHNFPPTASIQAVRSPSDDATWMFLDRSTDLDGTVVARRWELQGRVVSSSTVAHRFTEPGAHVVTLTVTDDKGASASAERTVVADDVLQLRASVQKPAAGQDPVRLDVRGAWLNDTGVPASYSVTVRYRPANGVPSQAVFQASGTLDEDGRAAVDLRSPVPGRAPPGRYDVQVRAWTSLGYGGNLEAALAFLSYDVPPA